MMGKFGLLLLLLFFISGCATLNFSANYYSPPSNYKSEVNNLWTEINSNFSLKYKYTLRIVDDNECQMPGIPENDNGVVKLPVNYLKYVYQNYYDNRFTILTCLIVHELCHSEYDLPDNPPETHFQTDLKAISLLSCYTTISAEDYYKSIYVVKNYWFARKGIAGHAFNVGWNALQIVSLVNGGSYCFMDWFATDLDVRLNLLSSKYEKMPPCFAITKDSKNNTNSEKSDFKFAFKKTDYYKIESLIYPDYTAGLDVSEKTSINIVGEK